MKNNILKFIWVWAMLCSTWLLAETRSHEVKGDANATSKKQNIKKKSPIGYDESNYLFIYNVSYEIDPSPGNRTIVLVKNHVPVLAALLYSHSNGDRNLSIPRFIDLDNVVNLEMVMDIINGKKCQEKEQEFYKFDAAHFPIAIEGCQIKYDSKSKTCEYGGKPYYPGISFKPISKDEKTECGNPYFYFTHYEKVDASYTKIELKKERFKELERNHKRWRALNLKNYSFVQDRYHIYSEITTIIQDGAFVKQIKSEDFKERDIPQEERFMVMDDVFDYVKEKLEESSCKVVVEYQVYREPNWYPQSIDTTCKGEKSQSIMITVSENKENTNEK